MKKVKISELPLCQNKKNLFTIATDSSNNSVRVGIGEFIYTETTYAELLRDLSNSYLIPGMLYRITDYVTTCNPSGSVVGVTTSSENHAFDVLVTATSVNTIDSEAKACLHSGDTYFANSRLNMWRIRYDINNDTSLYSWADPDNGKGVIYYMQDEFGNEAPYDFKNIKFNSKFTFNYSGTDYSLKGIYCYENKMKGYYRGPQMTLNNNVLDTIQSNVFCRGNIFDINCYSNYYNNGCNDIVCGSGCYSISLFPTTSNIVFGNNCHDIMIDFMYAHEIYFGKGCAYLSLMAKNTSSANRVRNIHIADRIFGTAESIIRIVLTPGSNHKTNVALKSDGTIVQFNEADLV